MPSLDLVDHSAHNDTSVPPLANASRLVLIDNYDSFTWNVYQYLVLEGATVSVYRNDKITLQELKELNPTQLVISPGPGHPERDAGVSGEAMKHFAGKIPILGVCMGAQCIFSIFGGQVNSAGEIIHGKTSELKHDGKGLYVGLPQDLPVTRYHSLAGMQPTLPDCLKVSAWSARSTGTGTDTIIMGVRHDKYVLEGVQFHPESILTAQGRTMLKNFLKMKGGTWEENDRESDQLSNGSIVEDKSAVNGSSTPDKRSILDKIYEHRKAMVASQMAVPSQRMEDLQAAYDLGLAPPQIPFSDRLRKSPFPLSLMAEIKRASPSKGIISLGTCAPEQARKYAAAGASVISVLTEPEWFKGSIDDLRAVRQALQGYVNRPAILRKDFIFNEYQILEARLAGADSVLLIVKMLEKDVLARLYRYSLSLGMEPLVEVNNEMEMQVAVDLGAKAIGVNNRNLTSFDVDLNTTSRLVDMVPEGTFVCALSGISGPKDVDSYKANKVGAVLVGEALMRAEDPHRFTQELLGFEEDSKSNEQPKPLLVKVCGIRTTEAAEAAISARANLIGMILAPGRSRSVSDEDGQAISRLVKKEQNRRFLDRESFKTMRPIGTMDYFSLFEHIFSTNQLGPLLVGVFQDQPLEYILTKQRQLDLNVVQLHGSEPVEWSSLIPVPVIRAFKPGDIGIASMGCHALPLLDSGRGGTGKRLDTRKVMETLEKNENLRVMLAGGLNHENVKNVIEDMGSVGDRVVGVDVSSGVEDDSGIQDPGRIKMFVETARKVRFSL
ncbi:MAG: bifunctional tryptophan synthase trp1 [Watsoniomyces obsoletus]|nr:MAG: bifunctional tryptophan synthase trp1 [Watsoniomyces obsoletus]